MVKYLWSVICRRHLVDPLTQAVSLIDIIDGITVNVPPGGSAPNPLGTETLLVDIEVVSYWIRKTGNVPEKAKCRIVLITPRDPQPITRPEFEVDVESADRARVFARLTTILYRTRAVLDTS